MRDLVPFVQSKKREKHTWRSDTFSKLQALVCNFTKSNTTPSVFFTFFKLNKLYQIAQRISYSDLRKVFTKLRRFTKTS